METRPLLLEIGTEEIPARFIPGACENLSAAIRAVLDENSIECADVKVYATPRRMAVIAEGVSEMQADRVREALGPARKVAFDDSGKPTKAAEGFARSQGIEPGELVIKETEKGEYVAAVVKEKGRPVRDLLAGLLSKVVLSLNFPKSMRWGDGEMRFARPIHWVVALFGGETVEFELDGIHSGNMSRGHRFLSPGDVEIKVPEEYVEKLRERHVVVSQGERVKLVETQAQSLAESIGGEIWRQHEHQFRDVANLVEYPQAVLGSFSEKYLELPDELLAEVMWGHQKYFSIVDGKNELKNYFVIVSNTSADNADTVQAGAERVIRARFEDARFYYEEDRKVRLEQWVEGLRNVTFHEKIGTTYEKTLRVQALAALLAESICPAKAEAVKRAAYLSKADLLTGVVREFPELQGVMGMYYARLDGEEDELAVALREQYLPAFSGDAVPFTDIGTVLSLADRLDNLAAFFAVGLRPTGSEDPFALRRQALGVVAVLREKGYALTVGEMVGAALKVLDVSGLKWPKDVKREIVAFFEQRLEPLLTGEGFEYDIVQAVLPMSAGYPLHAVMDRLNALREFKSHAAYNDFLTAIKRVRNILAPVLKSGEDIPEVDDLLFREESERELHGAYLKVRESTPVGSFIQGERKASVASAMEEFVTLIGPVNTFFDKVLVMDKDEAVKKNRLALLRNIWSMMLVAGDFSKLQERASL